MCLAMGVLLQIILSECVVKASLGSQSVLTSRLVVACLSMLPLWKRASMTLLGPPKVNILKRFGFVSLMMMILKASLWFG